MTTRTLNTVPCPVCKGKVEGITVEEETILNATRVPVMVLGKCENGHAVVLFVDRNFTIRDTEAAVSADSDSDSEESSVDKAIDWMDSF
ncbi:MAG: hypothetical protein K9W43_12885 [Candidatus Thorarchaeota archaeon]|nr:hypothetical protein [Candidatus Thorarchaeota archaeon]